MCDRIFAKYFAPKRKKKNNIAPWIIGALAFAALMPLAVKCDKKKREWGVASLLFFVGCKPSAKHDDRREVTLAIPGAPYAKSMLKEYCVKCRTAKAALAEQFDELDDELTEMLSEDGIEPDVTVTEE